MSDIDNLDVMLGSYQRNNSGTQDGNNENEIDLRSNRRGESLIQNENDYRSYLNTNLSENSCSTVETRRLSGQKFCHKCLGSLKRCKHAETLR